MANVTRREAALLPGALTVAGRRRRPARWGEVQRLTYEEAPIIRIGNCNALGVRSRRLDGLTPAIWPFFWNAWVNA